MTVNELIVLLQGLEHALRECEVCYEHPESGFPEPIDLHRVQEPDGRYTQHRLVVLRSADPAAGLDDTP